MYSGGGEVKGGRGAIIAVFDATTQHNNYTHSSSVPAAVLRDYQPGHEPSTLISQSNLYITTLYIHTCI